MNEWVPDLNFCIPAASDAERRLVIQLIDAGLTNIGWLAASPDIEEGDVLIPMETGQHLIVYRHSDNHHSLQLTNRCNSRCLMCSQPPTTRDDSWMQDEAKAIILHIRNMPRVLGLSGGEPLLLGSHLRDIIDCIHAKDSTTHVEVLTNGRSFSNGTLVKKIFATPLNNVSWLVPLYGHCDFLHDFVVQAEGAFEETIAGLLALQAQSQPIQLRIVLIEPVLEVLTDLCEFIGRNLPFVREVSLMACEPIGYALANRQQCEVDLAMWHETLLLATAKLRRLRVPFLFMNTPLCALPFDLQQYAHQSISDWKNVYAEECNRCVLRSQCCGLFSWYEKGWQPTKITAIREIAP